MKNDTDKSVKDAIEEYLQTDKPKGIDSDALVKLILANVLANINAGGHPDTDIKVSVIVYPPVAGVHIQRKDVWLATNWGKIHVGCV